MFLFERDFHNIEISSIFLRCTLAAKINLLQKWNITKIKLKYWFEITTVWWRWCQLSKFPNDIQCLIYTIQRYMADNFHCLLVYFHSQQPQRINFHSIQHWFEILINFWKRISFSTQGLWLIAIHNYLRNSFALACRKIWGYYTPFSDINIDFIKHDMAKLGEKTKKLIFYSIILLLNIMKDLLI